MPIGPTCKMCSRTEEEIEAEINSARESAYEGSSYPCLTFEEGVVAALLWVTGQTNDKPMEE